MDAPLSLVLIGDGPLTTAFLNLYSRYGQVNSLPLRLAAVVAKENATVNGVRTLGALAVDNVPTLARVLPEPDVVLLTEEFGVNGGAVDPSLVRDSFGGGTAVLNQEAGRFLLRMMTARTASCHWGPLHSPSLFRSLMDQLREDVLLLDTKGFLVDCNMNLVSRKGRPKEDLIGHHYEDILDEDENLCKMPDTQCPFTTAVTTGTKAEAMYSRVDPEGRVQYIRVYAYPLFGTDGKVAFVAEMRRDITRRTHMEQRLQQSEKLAAIGELSTYLAHEIRNPLFVISGFANSLYRSADLPESAKEKISAILEESRRLDEILKAIFNFSRPPEGGTGEVDLADVVRDTMQVLRFVCEREDIHVELDLADNLPKAKGDPETVKQCLVNLVKNSVEAMESGGTLTIRAGQDLSHLTLSVQDNGPGIPEEDRAKVFSPFFSTKDKGAGLGLAMIKKMIEDMGGEVVLHSITGQGTTVTLRLPPALAVPDQDGLPPLRPRKPENLP